MEPLVQTLLNCVISCKKCHQLCLGFLKDTELKVDEGHRQLLLDCASLCSTNSEHLSREPHSDEMCAMCATMCRQCSEAINDLPQMGDPARDLAEECHKCAALCEIVAEQTAMAHQAAAHEHPQSANGGQS